MRKTTRGVTLLEMIVVIVITGIIGTAIAVFIRRPMEGYVDATRRAELSDIADTALRRITRDLRTALPNSIRVDVTGMYIEYLQTSGGGRYRAEQTSTGTGNTLDFTFADDRFDVIGTMPAMAAGNFIVVYNLNSAPTIATANAYGVTNRATYQSDDGTTITLAAGIQFPAASPGKRFQVVQFPVTYHCDLGTGVLRRFWGYPIQLTPQPAPPAGGSNAVLASNVTDCRFIYAAGATQQTGVVALTLQISQGGETVRLFQQVQISNVP